MLRVLTTWLRDCFNPGKWIVFMVEYNTLTILNASQLMIQFS